MGAVEETIVVTTAAVAAAMGAVVVATEIVLWVMERGGGERTFDHRLGTLRRPSKRGRRSGLRRGGKS